MTDFKAIVDTADAVMVSAVGERVTLRPRAGAPVDGLHAVIETNVNIESDLGTRVALENLITMTKSDVGDLVQGDRIETDKGKVWTVRRPLQDDGHIVTVIVA